MIALSSNEPTAGVGAQEPRLASLQGKGHVYVLYQPIFIPETSKGPENGCLIGLGSCQVDKAGKRTPSPSPSPAVSQGQEETVGKAQPWPIKNHGISQDKLGYAPVTNTSSALHLRGCQQPSCIFTHGACPLWSGDVCSTQPLRGPDHEGSLSQRQRGKHGGL